ncbi:MAG: hydrogenase nickel incorporation protein HypB [Anaerolineae bacterium]|nr:hydrogenase nickel incorporation protein HypB [Anaerolineae bacterium]
MPQITVVKDIMSVNDELAAQVRAQLDAAGVLALNIMASPGAGKTSVITRTIDALKDKYQIAALDGDVATVDVEKIARTGIQVQLVNTGGNCHLDANMIHRALPTLDLSGVDLLLVENVGNLICPAAFELGTHYNIVIASVPEGDDKPYKYPAMFRGADVLLLNKTDLLQYLEFNVDYFQHGVEVLNPGLAFLPVSAQTGDGFETWLNWIKAAIAKKKSV